MQHTKERFGKPGGVVGYHLVHSYAPGETTPELAHEAGVEFARRLLGDKYQAVVCTHVNKEHLHCHIVFNSVSFVDGVKYRNAFKDYFEDIRGISNEVSRKYGFSVIQPEGSGQHYAEWNAERSGKTTIRDLVRQDLDAAIAASFTFASLLDILRKRGYTVKYGSNVKHTAVKPPGGARFLRLDKTIHRHRPEITLPVVLPLRGTYSAGCPQSRPADAGASTAKPASVRTGWALTATTQRKCGSQGEQTREAR